MYGNQICLLQPPNDMALHDLRKIFNGVAPKRNFMVRLPDNTGMFHSIDNTRYKLPYSTCSAHIVKKDVIVFSLPSFDVLDGSGDEYPVS